MSSQLESLPTEIQGWLLCWLLDVPSLMSLIRASPLFLQVYRANRNAIYTNVVCNHIDTGLLPIALVAMKLRELDTTIDMHIFQHLITDVKHKHDLVDISALSVQDAKQLLRFHKIIDEFAQSFAKESLMFVRSYTTPGKLDFDETNINLSPSEHHRALRGLYNWELISIVCHYYMEAWRSDDSQKTQFFDSLKMILDTLTIYEQGEVFFVIYFFRERLSHFIDQAEDDRFEEFVDRGPGHPHFFWEDDVNDFFFTTVLRGRQDDWINTMLWSRDIRSQYRLLNIPTPADRLTFIEDTDSLLIEGQNPLAEQLVLRQRQLFNDSTISAILKNRLPGIKLPLQDEIDNYEEGVSNVNLGLLWAYSITRKGLDGEFRDKISGLGLVIWDKERIQTMNMFSIDWHLLCYNNMQGFYATRREKPSVEKRAERQEFEWKIQEESSKETRRIEEVSRPEDDCRR